MNHQCKYELDPKVTAPALSSDDLPSTTTISHGQTKGGNDKKTHHSGQITIRRNNTHVSQISQMGNTHQTSENNHVRDDSPYELFSPIIHSKAAR